mmetsp:Transcript_66534/g.100264  ORF Transcript_66534/g.100264 Transcript_66534/m.100264 type:complete len:96 (-) Transcript_66534:32-319(-)
MGARVAWPAACPDDILEGIINETHECLKRKDFSKDGEETKGEEIAEELKKFCDATYEPSWHVFFGKNFGCHATHEKGRFIFFYIEKNAFCFYKMS